MREDKKFKAAVISVVPSPYQRDLFGALARRPEVDLAVYYMARETPENPWPEAALYPFEKILPGRCATIGGSRINVNWSLPDLSNADFVVLNTVISSLTAQWLMRHRLEAKPWIFWGEVLRSQPLGWRDMAQRCLLSPLKKATAIAAIGRRAEADYRKRFPGIPVFCIPYHCDLDVFLTLPPKQKKTGPLKFFCCGQMIRRKGVDLLIKAFDNLVQSGLDVELLLVGREAELPEFLAATSQTARSRICYAGFQAPEDLPKFFAMADVFVLPSRHDGWGVVINQAIGAGLPIITTDAVGAGLDLVERQVNGQICRTGDLEGLETAMRTLAMNPKLAAAWGAASRQKALSIIPAAGAQKWIDAFRRLATRHQGNAENVVAA